MNRASSTIDSLISGSSHGVETVSAPRASSPLLSSDRQKDFIVTEIANGLIERFSRPIEKYNDEELRGYLQRDLEDLKRMDPMIPIVRKLHDGSWDLEENTVRLGSYRVSSPSIKSLNDLYLGPIATDRFIADLHEAIEATFRSDLEVLRRFFKGGTFDLKLAKTEDVASHLGELRETMSAFHGAATDILLRHISEHMTAYEAALSEDGLNAMRFSTADLEMNLKALSSDEKQGKLLSSYLTLRRFQASIAEGIVPVEISFGINETQTVNPKEVAFAICCAERAANMGAYRNYESRKMNGGNSHERNPLQEYAHEYLFADLISARTRIHRFTTEGDDEDLRVKPEWRPFFEFDEKKRLRMTEKMISMHRKNEYEEGLDPGMIDVFASYYAAMNEVDVLRNFRVAHFDQYFERSLEIDDLMQLAEMALEDPDLSRRQLESMLRETTEQLELSIKDEGEGISRTQRAVIRALMAEGPKILLMGDHIGFGIRNVQSNEKLVTILIEKLGLTQQEIPLHVNDHQAFLAALKKRLNAMDPVYWDTLFAIGDPGTAHLRRTEKALFDYFDGKAVCDANGGDEMTIVAPVPNKGLPDEELFDKGLQPNADQQELNHLRYEVNRVMTEVLAKARVRAAIILMPDGLKKGEGDQYTKALRYAERTHRRLKKLPDVYVLSEHQKNLAQ